MSRRRKPPEPAPLEIQSRVQTYPGPNGSVSVAPQFTEIELEILQRLLEQQPSTAIQHDMGLSRHAFDKVLGDVRFQREFELQAALADRGIRVRMERLASEALDVVRTLMRSAISPHNKLRAALEILDRSGYVKVEKRVTITADAESVIRELNRLAGRRSEDASGVVGNERPEEEPQDAMFEDIARSVAASDGFAHCDETRAAPDAATRGRTDAPPIEE